MKLLRYIGIHCILGVLLMVGFSACHDEFGNGNPHLYAESQVIRKRNWRRFVWEK